MDRKNIVILKDLERKYNNPKYNTPEHETMMKEYDTQKWTAKYGDRW